MLKLDSKLMRFLDSAADYLVLNILFVIFSLPIFTIGAANTARYYAAMKPSRDKDIFAVKDFCSAFFKNFKMATPIWLLFMIIDGTIGYNWYVLMQDGAENPGNKYLMALILATFFAAIVQVMIFPYIARYENTFMGTLRMGVTLAILNLVKMVLIIGVEALPFILAYRWMRWAALSIPVGCSVALYINSNLIAEIFKKLEEKVYGDGSEAEEVNVDDNVIDDVIDDVVTVSNEDGASDDNTAGTTENDSDEIE